MLNALRSLASDLLNHNYGPDLDAYRQYYLDQPKSGGGQLACAYRTLLEVLLNLSPSSLNPQVTRAGAPLLHTTHPEQCILHPHLSLELANTWCRIGALQNNLELQRIGARGCAFIQQLIDKWQRPFAGFLFSENDRTAAPNTHSEHHLELHDFPPTTDHELGLAIHHTERHSLALSATGWGTGSGSIMGQDVGILSFGLSQFPDKLTGTHLTPAHLEDFKHHNQLPGFNVQKRGPIFSYSAWTRTMVPETLWCQVNICSHQDIDLTMQCFDLQNKPLSVYMAVKAGNLRVGDQIELSHGSLRQYQGNIKTIALKGTQSQMVILPQEAGEMQIIPLAADASYWGADYLLTYPFDPHSSKLRWNIY